MLTGFDKAQKLLELLGSFWASTYAGNDFLRDVLLAKGRAVSQTLHNLNEVAACLSRDSIPVFHKETWYSVTLRQSEYELLKTVPLFYREDTPHVYSNDTGLTYGGTETLNVNRIKRPAGLVRCPIITSGITNPSTVLLENVDYELSDEFIVFRKDLFSDLGFSKVELLSGTGEIVDKELTLWFYNSQWDRQYLYLHYGHALGARRFSSEQYKQLLNCVFDSLVAGSSAYDLERAIAAIFGIPITKEDGEKVESIWGDGLYQYVITDKHVYEFSWSSKLLVSVGDTLSVNQPLSDDFSFVDMSAGYGYDVETYVTPFGFDYLQPTEVGAYAVPGSIAGIAGSHESVLSDITHLSADSSILRLKSGSVVNFPNKDVELLYEGDDPTKVYWTLEASETTEKAFWSAVRALEASGTTLAEIITGRPKDEITAGSLPTHINPMRVMVDNFFRFHCSVVFLRIRSGAALPFGFPSNLIRKILPPEKLLFFVLSQEAADDIIQPVGPGTSTTPGIEESVSFELVLEIRETITDDIIADDVSFSDPSSNCS